MKIRIKNKKLTISEDVDVTCSWPVIVSSLASSGCVSMISICLTVSRYLK